MATTPATTNGFQPAFTRVEQSNDFDDAFACIAMLANKPLAEIKQLAIEKCKHPKHGPYAMTDALITKLFSYFGLISTPYKELRGSLSALAPDVAILWIATDAENEVGRHVVFHRARSADSKSVIEYVIDPAFWITDPAMQIRTDLKALGASWFISVHPAAVGGK